MMVALPVRTLSVKVPEPVAAPSVRTNGLPATVRVAVLGAATAVIVLENVPGIVLDVALGVKVKTFAPFVMMALPLLRTFAAKVPVPVALVATLAVRVMKFAPLVIVAVWVAPGTPLKDPVAEARTSDPPAYRLLMAKIVDCPAPAEPPPAR